MHFTCCTSPATAECQLHLYQEQQGAALTHILPMQGYEIPRDFIVEMDPFSKANHLLTDSGKPARGKLKSK